MKKSIISNYIYNLSFQIISILFPLITTPYLSRILGVEKIGIFSYTLSITTYFILLSSLGINLYGQREVAYVQDNIEKRSKIFNDLFCIRLTIITFVLFIFLLFILFIKSYKVYFILWILELIGTFFDISWFFQGLEEFKKTISRNFLVKILCLVLIFIFVKSDADLGKYILIYSLATFIGNLSLWIYVPKYVKFMPKYENLNIIKYLKNLFIFFIPQLATKIYTLLDKTMIGIFYDNKSEVGYYEQSQKIIFLLLTILTSLGTVLMPRIASYFSKKDYKKIKECILNSFEFVFALGIPIFIGVILCSKYIIPLYLGDGYDKSVILMELLSPIIIVVGLSNITGIQLLVPMKKQKEYNMSVIIGAIINFVLNLFFIYFWGSIGAAITTLLAEVIILLVQLKHVKNIISVKEILIISKKYIIMGIFLFISCFFIRKILPNDLFISLIIMATFTILEYFILLYIFNKKKLINILYNIRKRGEKK